MVRSVYFLLSIMSKKVLIERLRIRQNLYKSFYLLQQSYKKVFNRRTTVIEWYNINCELQLLQRRSFRTCIHNRCQISGRSRAYYRNFSLSRHFIREFSNQGFLPGVEKSSDLCPHNKFSYYQVLYLLF